MIRRSDSSLPVTRTRTFEDALAESVARERLSALISGGLALTGLLLASLGLYGLLALHVTERTREIGLRIALGAELRRVTRSVVAGGLRLVGVGAAVGVIGALLLLPWVGTLLFGITPYDLSTYVGQRVSCVRSQPSPRTVQRGGQPESIRLSRCGRSKPMLDTIARDLRNAVRSILRSPGFSGTAVLTLALGIAGTTVMFALIQGVLLRPLPVHEQDRLIVAWKEVRTSGSAQYPFGNTEIEAVADAQPTPRESCWRHTEWRRAVRRHR